MKAIHKMKNIPNKEFQHSLESKLTFPSNNLTNLTLLFSHTRNPFKSGSNPFLLSGFGGSEKLEGDFGLIRCKTEHIHLFQHIVDSCVFPMDQIPGANRSHEMHNSEESEIPVRADRSEENISAIDCCSSLIACRTLSEDSVRLINSWQGI
jgi:hypothetical protein